MTEKQIRIEARELTDFKVLQHVFQYEAKKKMPSGSKWDAVTENCVVEIKNRDKYKYDSFPTFALSLHKLDHLELGRKTEGKRYSVVLGIYPLSNKVVLFDVTKLNQKNANIEWKRVKKTEYADGKSIYVWEPKVMLDLKEGKHDNYITMVINTDLSWVEEDYQENYNRLKQNN